MSSEDEYDIPPSPPTGSPSLTSPASPSRTQLTSSPPGSPAHSLSGEAALSSQEGRGCNRPAKDMTQFADYVARHLKLKADRKASLLQFSKLGSPEQRITMAAHFFKFAERQEELQPAEAVFTLTETAKKNIDRMSFLVSLSPSVPAYLESSGAFSLIMEKLEKKYLSMKKDDPQYITIAARIRDKCTDVRYTTKKEIMGSIGTVDPNDETKQIDAKDIVTLCEDILDKTGLSPTLEMCGQLSFLRHVYAKGPAKDPKYWKVVDQQLVKIRKKHKDDKRKIHKVFKKILDDDETKYGSGSTSTDLLPAGGADPMEVEDTT